VLTVLFIGQIYSDAVIDSAGCVNRLHRASLQAGAKVNKEVAKISGKNKYWSDLLPKGKIKRMKMCCYLELYCSGT